MKKNALCCLTTIAILMTAIPRAFAETRTISWDPVTTYTDSTSIEAGKTVKYTAYWTTNAGLSLDSLHEIASSLGQTAATFDPDLQGMTRGQTVYFTAKSVLSAGESSALSIAYPWVVPLGTPSRNPAAPANIGVAGPVSSAAAEVWRLTWDPVTTYGDGASLEPGRTVRYTPYWTTDPALSHESLKSLASSMSATTLEFNPAVQKMMKNQVAYLTVKAILDNGDPSSPGAVLTWRVDNEGPVAPSGGKISKR